MGSAVRAQCECGFEQEFMIGGGMLTFHELCCFPCLCQDCHRIVTTNLLDQSPTCPDCGGTSVVPYDQKELMGNEGSNNVTEWSPGKIGRQLALTDGSYYCPQCDSYRLRFEDSGLCWD